MGMAMIKRDQPPRHNLHTVREVTHKRPEEEIRKDAKEQLNGIYTRALRRMSVWAPQLKEAANDRS